MRILPLLLCLPLTACMSADARTLASWAGIYETERQIEGPDSCEAGDEVEPDPPFFEIDTALGIDAHLIALRRCASVGSCDGASWFEAIVVDIGDKRIGGDTGDYVFFTAGVGGTCNATWAAMDLSRDTAEAKGLRVEIEVHVAEGVQVDDEEACLDALAALPDDGVCRDSFVFEGTRVE